MLHHYPCITAVSMRRDYGATFLCNIYAAVQVGVHNRSCEPLQLYFMLHRDIDDKALCMRLAKVMQRLLDPDLTFRLTASQVVVELQEQYLIVGQGLQLEVRLIWDQRSVHTPVVATVLCHLY